MLTLIMPCAGKSSRFPNMKPKWMLTHPDGKLMIEKALDGFDQSVFDRIIITIVKPQVDKYEADLVLRQVFSNSKIEICILDDFTKSASETIVKTLDKMNVKGAFIIKDSDNFVKFELPKSINNRIVAYDLMKHPDVTNIPGKSFLISERAGEVGDIVEKRVVSNLICLGVYEFKSSESFIRAYNELKKQSFSGEMFVSQVISYMIKQENESFYIIEATNYSDWGTLREWRQVQKNCSTYFIDVDGVLLRNSGRYGSFNWSNNESILEDNCLLIKELQDQGAQIIITTARTEEFRPKLVELLESQGIYPYAILMGLNHSTRVLVNDFAPTNPYPSGVAISFPRNECLRSYLNQ